MPQCLTLIKNDNNTKKIYVYVYNFKFCFRVILGEL